MRILIVSDSHGKNENLRNLTKRVPDLDLLIHLGDTQCSNSEIEAMVNCPVEIVKGNCDWNSQNPTTRIITLEGLNILLTHGHEYSVDYSLIRLVQAAREKDCKIAMFGHTHVPCIDENSGDVTILNPGSISKPRQEGHRPSFILMEIVDGVPRYNLTYM